MFFDFHTHLHQYAAGDPLLAQITAHKIYTVAASMNAETYALTKKRAQGNPFVLSTFGIHPWAAADFSEDEATALLAESVLIGEIGLDFFWCDVPKKLQERAFAFCLDHADRAHKACVIHTKGAEKRVLEILKHFPHAVPIIHWYHGPEKYFKEILDRGYSCTFGCDLKHSRYIRHLFSHTPAELVLAETDNPDSEVWLGGTRRDPLLIKEVVTEMAKVRKIDFDMMNEQILQNSFRIAHFETPAEEDKIF